MAKLDGKVALITGAAVGLGEGIATAYAKYGAKLIMVDLDPHVEETAEKLRKEYGSEIVTVVANVADREQIDAAAGNHLFYTLAFGGSIVAPIALHKVDDTPNADTGTDSSYNSGQGRYSSAKKFHRNLLMM